MTREQRKAVGLKGREWALSDEAGFTSKHQANRVMEAFAELFETWTPREKYEIVNAITANINSFKLLFITLILL